MLTGNCETIHEAVLRHMAERTAVEHIRDLCVLTLPIRTIDGRLVDVFVESRASDYFLVHDAGKAVNELILRGVNVATSINHHCEQIAASYGVQWADETFQVRCKASGINAAALGVAMCSSMAMLYLLDQLSKTEDNVVRAQFGEALKLWGRNRSLIKTNVTVGGQWKQHSFDFVAYPKTGAEPIAINVINPGASPIAAADRAAFRVKDMEGTKFSHWRKVVVETRAETWTKPAKQLLAKCSDAVIKLNSGVLATPSLIAESLDVVLRVA